MAITASIKILPVPIEALRITFCLLILAAASACIFSLDALVNA
ncbi:MAG: hypothetical protein ABI863_01870 [Ginsengibacter sp.]